MNTSQKIVFFGTEDFSAVSLEGLLNADVRIAAVVTRPDAKKGRGQKVTAPRVKTLAESHGIPVLQPTRLSDIVDFIRSLQPVTGVLVSYGRIIPQSMIDLFTPGIINVHPSLLPVHRGPTPIESAIYEGDDTTGVSIMQLSRAMDAGPVYAQVSIPLNGTETGPGLAAILADLGTAKLVRVLPSILNGSLAAAEQDDDSATYCSLLTKSDGVLDPRSMTAAQAERHVRAYLGYPRSRLIFGPHEVIVTKARVSNELTTLSTTFSDGSRLVVDELIAPSGKPMDAASFSRGYLNN